MWLDWVSKSGPLALESDTLLTALHGLAGKFIFELVQTFIQKCQAVSENLLSWLLCSKEPEKFDDVINVCFYEVSS